MCVCVWPRLSFSLFLFFFWPLSSSSVGFYLTLFVDFLFLFEFMLVFFFIAAEFGFVSFLCGGRPLITRPPVDRGPFFLLTRGKKKKNRQRNHTKPVGTGSKTQ